ncbi:two component transcriptional regulator, LuxR family [Reichenbachiella agariperforans]|uniref:Two component transcriptional regulator, LuxR family n=1 Tax=Reichenbachiella agariperforans TaxID=156994 RepID=A0A1M6T0S6_REIAG|nr:response regulator transcription factor [Reichenbachiella agariperforans]SHK50603.1 two component transcriptional regulator, LuxR family [Reichenbachiella agariperforans]
MISVILADDHSVVRKGLKLLLEESGTITVVAEASSGEQALELVKEHAPQVLVTDISMPGMSGLDLIPQVKKHKPDTQILVLSTHNDEEYILVSFEAGALGYLPKNTKAEQLIAAVEKIATGDLFYTPEVIEILGASLIKKRSPGKSIKSWLTKREKEILAELVEGSTNKEIAEKLFLSTRTIDSHRRNIMKKLNVSNSAQLVKMAIEKNLI